MASDHLLTESCSLDQFVLCLAVRNGWDQFLVCTCSGNVRYCYSLGGLSPCYFQLGFYLLQTSRILTIWIRELPWINYTVGICSATCSSKTSGASPSSLRLPWGGQFGQKDWGRIPTLGLGLSHPGPVHYWICGLEIHFHLVCKMEVINLDYTASVRIK